MNPEPKTEAQRALACLPDAPQFLQDVMGSGEARTAIDASSKPKLAPFDLQAKYEQLDALRVKIATMIQRAANPDTPVPERQQCYMMANMYGNYATVIGMLLQADALTVADRMKNSADNTIYIKRFGIAGIVDQLDDLLEWAMTFQQKTKALDSKGEPVVVTKPVGQGVLELWQAQLAMLKRALRFMAAHTDPEIVVPPAVQQSNEMEMFGALDQLGVPIPDIFSELDVGTAAQFLAARAQRRRAGDTVEPLTPDSVLAGEEKARTEAERDLQGAMGRPVAK